MQLTKRLGLFVSTALVMCPSLVPFGCEDRAAKPMAASALALRTDAKELARLCVLPQGVTSVEWSTYQMGNDWGLLARIKMSPPDVVALMSKLKLNDGRRVVIWSDLPTWLGEDAKVFTKTGAGFESTIPVYQPGPFTKSPLLNGFVVNPGPDTILVGLHTN